MNIPLQMKCAECQQPSTVKMNLDATSLDWKCENCGHENHGFFGTEVTIGFLLLLRSRHELLVEGDYSMSILLAAMALEAELSRLFRKWSGIAALRSNRDPDEDQIEEMLRRFGTINDKIEGVAVLLHAEGIDKFVEASAEFSPIIREGFPSLRIGSLAGDLQKTLFWARNKIIHGGYAKSTKEEAQKCHNVAWLGLRVFESMDLAKRAAP